MDTGNIKEQWDKKYLSSKNLATHPARVLLRYQHLLPKKGVALDLACGFGANALYLAKKNLTVIAWDISTVALDRLTAIATVKKLPIQSEVRDIIQYPPEASTFDVIVVSHFLDRTIMKDIKSAIKKDGLIYYQTFIKEKTNAIGPHRADYLLEKNELLCFFQDWTILLYHEEGKTGNQQFGFRDEAMLVAKNDA